ncbi:hypothetical protein LTSERUB_2012, partial [Salmonella enterica subsp. enterica serovar Rubislaw str. A4-653]
MNRRLFYFRWINVHNKKNTPQRYRRLNATTSLNALPSPGAYRGGNKLRKLE